MLASKGTFTIETDPARRLIRVAMQGFWDESVVIAYDRACRVAALKVMEATGCAKDDLLALVDARQGTAQTQDLLAKFKERFDLPDRQPRRIATIVSSALFKRQVERIATPNQRVFEDEASATAWLFS